MKTFTKAVSVILIAVMCLSLFATSAYASGETFNLNGAPSSNSGNVFNLGGASDAGNSNSFSTNSGNTSNNDSFSNNNSNSNSFNLNNSSYDASNNTPSFATQSNNDTKGDTTGDTKGATLLGGSLKSPYSSGMVFDPKTASITVTDTGAKNIITTAKGFAGNSFQSLSYGTNPTGLNSQTLPESAYKINAATGDDDHGNLELYASWLRSLTPATYYFFGQPANDPIVTIITITVNAGSAEDFGSFSVTPAVYTQRASTNTDLYAETVAVSATSSFDPFTKFAMIPQGASQGIFADGYIYKATNKNIAFSRTFLDDLTAGYYDIYGVTADNQQVKFGEVNIKAGNGSFTVYNSPYTQYKSTASDQYADTVLVRPKEATTTFGQFSGYSLIPQSSGSGVSANGYVSISSDQKELKLSRTLLDGVTAGYYDIYGTTASGQVKLGSVDVQPYSGTYSVGGTPYTQHASSEADQFASNLYVTSDSPLTLFTSYSLVPQGSTSGISTDGYTRSSADKTAVSFSRNLLDNIAAGAYEIYGITASGQQVKLGNAEIKSNNGTFSVAPTTYTQYASSEANQYAASVSVTAKEATTNFTQFSGYFVAPQGSTSGTSATNYVNVVNNPSKAGQNPYLTLSRNLLDGLTPGFYDIYGVTANGQQIKLGSVDVQGSENSYTVNPSNYTQYASDKENQYEDTVFVSTENGSFAQFSRYCVAPQNGGNSTYADSNVSVASNNKSMGFSRAFLDKLEAGNYTIYGVTAAGKQIKLGTMFITAGSITYTVTPSVYEQFASDNTDAYANTVTVTTSRTNSFDQYKKFALIAQNGGGSHYADGYVYAPDKATIKFSRTFLDGLEGGTYDIHGVDANGEMLKLGTVFIKAGNTGYTVNPTTYEQFVSNASSQYADTIFVKAEGTNTFAQFTRYKFAPQGSISGTYADGSVTTANDKRSIAFSRTFLDGLNAGYYDIYGVGSNGTDVKLGTVYIKLGDLAYTVTPSTYEQYATSDTNEYSKSVSVAATNASTNFTQFSRYAFIPQGSGVTSYADGYVNVVNASKEGKNPYVTFSRTFLDGLAGGYYDVYGIATNGKQVKFGSVYIKAGSGDYVVDPDVYTQYSTDAPIKVTAKTADFSRFTRFAVISMGSSSGGAYADGYTRLNSTKTELTFDEDFLDGLTAGYYDIYGVTSKGEQVKLGSMYIKASNGGFPDGKWDLWPDYTIPWTSGDDPLMFRSNLMALRQTYPRYTIVPRWGSGAGSIPNNMVDVNQFWDMGDGVFALGTNFLRSLPAGTYTLQVVDYKHLADCTNVVTFRIGSTLRPIDTDKHIIGSIKNLRFLCDEPVYEVYVGNIPLTYGEDYALSNGNKTITLSFEFLNKRSAGNTYTIKALTASGTYPSSTFQILSTAQGSASPRTGDESNLGLWAAFLLLSGAAVVVLVPKLRKHDF